ncbi:MAG: hypothetical protein WC867_00395 [Candidatus Pacearchaeota archaeon]|jgi:hypothetical protein
MADNKKETKNELEKVAFSVKDFIIDRMEILALILFVLCLFLLDVNLNKIMDNGLDVYPTVIGDYNVLSTSAFWFGFIAAFIIFIFISFRSVYERKSNLGFFDGIFGIVGIIGLMVILSGGLLAFFHDSSLEFPFFSYTVTRVTYYHTGIALSILSLIYFALTKPYKR